MKIMHNKKSDKKNFASSNAMFYYFFFKTGTILFITSFLIVYVLVCSVRQLSLAVLDGPMWSNRIEHIECCYSNPPQSRNWKHIHILIVLLIDVGVQNHRSKIIRINYC